MKDIIPNMIQTEGDWIKFRVDNTKDRELLAYLLLGAYCLYQETCIKRGFDWKKKQSPSNNWQYRISGSQNQSHQNGIGERGL